MAFLFHRYDDNDGSLSPLPAPVVAPLRLMPGFFFGLGTSPEWKLEVSVPEPLLPEISVALGGDGTCPGWVRSLLESADSDNDDLALGGSPRGLFEASPLGFLDQGEDLVPANGFALARTELGFACACDIEGYDALEVERI